MSAIFCDTSGLLALTYRDDPHHYDAAAAWRSLIAENAQLVSSNYVMTELLSLLPMRLESHVVYSFIERLDEQVETLWIDQAVHEVALRELFPLHHRRLSFVDCTSFILMRRHRIDKAFAFDSNFEEHGFTLLQP